jgi:pimeloyl-ACP methyl ester carboxylesterase
VLACRHQTGSGDDIADAHWVQVSNGDLHVRSNGSGPLVILLHGWTLDWRIWSPQINLNGFRLAMPDRRGFGQSTATPDLAGECADILKIADYFGAEDFAIVGLSQGAAVALDCARTFGSRIRAIGLIGAPLHHLVPEPAGVPEIDRVALARLVRNGRLGDMMTLWRQHELTQVAAHGRELLDMILADYDGRDQMVEQAPLAFKAQDIATLTMPVLAIAGAQDSDWRRRVADYIGSHAPYGQCNIVAHAGHVANVDAAEAVNCLLQNFLNAHHIEGN